MKTNLERIGYSLERQNVIIEKNVMRDFQWQR